MKWRSTMKNRKDFKNVLKLSASWYGVDSIIQQNVSGGDRSRASICIKILKYNTRFLFENLIECSQILLYNISNHRKV